jgi:hypothetical protein
MKAITFTFGATSTVGISSSTSQFSTKAGSLRRKRVVGTNPGQVCSQLSTLGRVTEQWFPPVIEIDIRPIYQGASTVPTEIRVSHRINNGRYVHALFDNTK